MSYLILGKTGLGRRKFIAEKESKAKNLDAKNLIDFRQRKQASLSLMKVKSDLHKSRLACQQLDTVHGFAAPSVDWYWPEEALPTVQEESDSSSDEEDFEMEVWVFVPRS